MAALDYADPDRNRYSYRMEGLRKAWVPRETERSADFTGLSPGEYVFRAKGANNDGVWNDEELTLSIRITPPFWRAPWFMLLVAGAMVVATQRAFAIQRARLLARQQAAVLASELNRKTEELEVARALQLSMLPPDHYRDADHEVIGMTRTASEVGGDYFDYFRVMDGRLCVLLGDATGHGSAAGLVVGMTKMGAAMWARDCDGGLTGLMDELNNGLKQSLARNMGMALGVALLDRVGGNTEMAFAGMPPPYCYRARWQRLEPLVMRCPPLGYLRKLNPVILDPEVEAGDTLIFLTDGFHERFDAENRIWGRRGLETALEKICREAETVEAIPRGLFAACDAFAHGRANEDDMTVLVIRFTSPRPGPVCVSRS
jgi:serine phosphatase RsbU (regulator of sigma subunit)